jgi:hypothetical protein
VDSVICHLPATLIDTIFLEALVLLAIIFFPKCPQATAAEKSSKAVLFLATGSDELKSVR